MDKAKVKTFLLKAADTIRDKGYARGTVLDSEGQMCMLGALNRVQQLTGQYSVQEDARNVLGDFLRNRTIGVVDTYNHNTITKDSWSASIIAAFSNMRVPKLAKVRKLSPQAYCAWVFRQAAKAL